MKKIINLICRFVTPLMTPLASIIIFTGVYMYYFKKDLALEETHAHLGIGFIFVVILHVFKNWTAMKCYFRTKSFYFICIFIIVLSIFIYKEHEGDIRPKFIVQYAIRSSVKDLSLIFKVNPESVIFNMRKDGIRVVNIEQTLKSIGRSNSIRSGNLVKYFVYKK